MLMSDIQVVGVGIVSYHHNNQIWVDATMWEEYYSYSVREISKYTNTNVLVCTKSLARTFTLSNSTKQVSA